MPAWHSPRTDRRPAPATIALLGFLGPVLTVHLSYAVSAAGGIVPACIPYLDGCTSISATGRHGPGYVLFKAGMLPSALVLVAYWRLCRDWLLEAGDADGPAMRSLLWLGIAGALFMVLYTVFLGHKGEVYNLLRRFGVTLNLGFTLLAQLLVVWRLRRLRDQERPRRPVRPGYCGPRPGWSPCCCCSVSAASRCRTSLPTRTRSKTPSSGRSAC